MTLGAQAVDYGGNVAVASDIDVSVIPDPPPEVTITSPEEGIPLIIGEVISITVNSTDNVRVDLLQVTINGVDELPLSSGTFNKLFLVPDGIVSLTIEATATDNLGRETTADLTVPVGPDPLTTAEGRVVDEDTVPVEGATVTCAGVSELTAADGTFSVPGIASISPAIQCTATLVQAGGAALRGTPALVPPVRGGITSFGDVVASPTALFLYPGPKISVGDRPQAMDVADVNGDGIDDIVTANRNSKDVSVVLGVGDGTFLAEQRFPIGFGSFSNIRPPLAIAVADLNADLKPDIVTINQRLSDTDFSASISVLLGNGNGTFNSPILKNVLVGSDLGDLISVAVADIDGDGIPDVVAGGQSRFAFIGGTTVRFDGGLLLFLGDGGGFLENQRRILTDDSEDGEARRSIVVADLNEDGNPDVVTTMEEAHKVSVLLGTGTGDVVNLFQPELLLDVGFGPYSVAVVDMNGDSNLDLVVLNRSATDPSILISESDVSVLLGNGDGFLDVVASHTKIPSFSVLLGNGDGTLLDSQRFGVSESLDIALADIDRNGNLDIIAPIWNGNTILTASGNGDGTFLTPPFFLTGLSPTSLAADFLDGDAFLDLVTTNATNDVSLLLGNGDGTFQEDVRFDAGFGPPAVSIGDVDGDGNLDLVVARNQDEISVLLGDGAGSFQDGDARLIFLTYSPPDLSGAGSLSGVVAAHLNDDAFLDVIVAVNFGGFVSVLLGTGTADPLFGDAQTFAAGGPEMVAVADLNGDGFLDAVTPNGNFRDLSILQGNGDGTFQAEQRLDTGDFSRWVEIADVNDDGFPDLITANVTEDNVSVLLGNGDGTFQDQQSFGAGDSPRYVAAVDVNGDGVPDLIVANQNSDDVSVLLGIGDGTFRDQQRFATGNNTWAVLVVDLDGDGRPEIVALIRSVRTLPEPKGGDPRGSDVTVLFHQ